MRKCAAPINLAKSPAFIELARARQSLGRPELYYTSFDRGRVGGKSEEAQNLFQDLTRVPVIYPYLNDHSGALNDENAFFLGSNRP